MKRNLLIVLAIILSSSILFSQNLNFERQIPMIGDSAPTFTGQSTMGNINFPDDYYGKWKILFSHPADFTPVCSTEILELAEMQDEFAELKTQILVISTDGLNSHIEWVKSLEEVNYKNWDNVKIKFPLIADRDLAISKKFGMIHPNTSETKNIRGVFIIDPDNKIRSFYFYPMTTGRNIYEIKRTLIALQATDKKDIFTPVNWAPGDDVLLPSPSTKKEADAMMKKDDPNLNSLNWYTWFKKM